MRPLNAKMLMACGCNGVFYYWGFILCSFILFFWMTWGDFKLFFKRIVTENPDVVWSRRRMHVET